MPSAILGVENDDDLLLDDPEKTLADMMDYKRMGGAAIVDATAIDYGREVEAVADLSKRSGLHVIGTAGFNKGFLWEAPLDERRRGLIGGYSTFKEWIEKSSVSELADFVCRGGGSGLEEPAAKRGR